MVVHPKYALVADGAVVAVLWLDTPARVTLSYSRIKELHCLGGTLVQLRWVSWPVSNAKQIVGEDVKQDQGEQCYVQGARPADFRAALGKDDEIHAKSYESNDAVGEQDVYRTAKSNKSSPDVFHCVLDVRPRLQEAQPRRRRRHRLSSTGSPSPPEIVTSN